MLVIGVVALIFAANGETPAAAPYDTVPLATVTPACGCLTTDTAKALPARFTVPADTPRTRRHAVELSESYERRLRIHRSVAYAVLPLFGVEYLAQRRLVNEGADAPAWARTTHRVAAGALIGAYALNAVTGVWNLWDSRRQPEHRALHLAHGLLMLASASGFTYAGVKLSSDAETSLSARRQYRAWALSSMGVTAASALMMRLFNH